MENQFIQFNNDIIEFGNSEIAVPTGKSTQFYFSEGEADRRELKVDIVTPDGGIVIKENAASINGAHITIYEPDIAPRDCYRLLVKDAFWFLAGEDIAPIELDGEVTQGAEKAVQIGHYYLIPLRRYIFKVKEYNSVTWRSNGVPVYVPTTIRVENQDGSIVYAEEYVNPRRNLTLYAEIGNDRDVYIRAYYRVDYPETDRAITISHKGIQAIDGEYGIKEKGYYSNLLIKEDDAQYAVVKYSCKEPAFGFPFDGTEYVQQLMPINLHSPQYKQEDKVYTKRNGEQVVLFANITKEYEGETDYIPMEWHEKILVALSCDEVYINGERVTKSGNYEIEHDNCTYSDCGIKLMRATFKVTTNVTQRNSNY